MGSTCAAYGTCDFLVNTGDNLCVRPPPSCIQLTRPFASYDLGITSGSPYDGACFRS